MITDGHLTQAMSPVLNERKRYSEVDAPQTLSVLIKPSHSMPRLSHMGAMLCTAIRLKPRHENWEVQRGPWTHGSTFHPYGNFEPGGAAAAGYIAVKQGNRVDLPVTESCKLSERHHYRCSILPQGQTIDLLLQLSALLLCMMLRTSQREASIKVGIGTGCFGICLHFASW